MCPTNRYTFTDLFGWWFWACWLAAWLLLFLFEIRRTGTLFAISRCPRYRGGYGEIFPKFKELEIFFEVKTILKSLNELYLYKYININKIKTKRSRAVRISKPWFQTTSTGNPTIGFSRNLNRRVRLGNTFPTAPTL